MQGKLVMRGTRLLLLPVLFGAVSAVLAADPNQASEPVSPKVVQDENSIDDLLLNRESYIYSAYGRRDPFGSLIKGKYARSENGALLDIGELSLVGTMWGDEDKFAVVQDKRNRSHVLREGDKVVNGRVIEITQKALTVQHYFFGETANVTIYMEEGEGK
jgi:hypothetical protein